MGDNGAGKSTLVRIISGVEQPDRGTIWFDGEVVPRLTPRSARTLGIETVHQHLALCDNLSGIENVMLGREPVRFRLGPLRIFDWKAAEEAEPAGPGGGRGLGARPELERPPAVGRPAPGPGHRPGDDRRRRMIIFDEPTAALGIKQTLATFQLIRQVAARGASIVLISHSIRDVLDIADRIVAMQRGRVMFDRPTAAVTEETLIEAIAG